MPRARRNTAHCVAAEVSAIRATSLELHASNHVATKQLHRRTVLDRTLTPCISNASRTFPGFARRQHLRGAFDWVGAEMARNLSDVNRWNQRITLECVCRISQHDALTRRVERHEQIKRLTTVPVSRRVQTSWPDGF